VRQLKIAVIGSGYVGLVNGVGLAGLGHQVTCVDAAEHRVNLIKSGQAPFHEPGLPERIRKVLDNGHLDATQDLAGAVRAADMTLIAVGTPFGDDKIDLSQIRAASTAIGEALKGLDRFHVVGVKSTVVPGTTMEVVAPTVEAASGRMRGDSLGFAMHPEFLREGSAVADFDQPDRIVIGSNDAKTADIVAGLYPDSTGCPVVKTSVVNAEFIKYSSNALLATLVSFSNEIAGMCETVEGADSLTVLQGVCMDRRLSPLKDGEVVRPGIHSFLRAGSGFGGSCLPKDVKALAAFARHNGAEPKLLQSVIDVNTARPDKVLRALDQELGSLEGRTVALLGLAFKEGTDDLRDSPSLTMLSRLIERKATVVAHDPLVPMLPEHLSHPNVTVVDSVEMALSGADAAVIGTACPEFKVLDWAAAASLMKAPVLLDARGALAGSAVPDSLKYLTIGTYFGEAAA